MKTVVTGGAGFIGSHLAEALSQISECTVIDNLSTGKRENIPKGVTLVEADVNDDSTLGRAFRGAQWVFHQAALPSVALSIGEPRRTHRANAEATLAVLVAAREAGVEKVVFASSAAVYGNLPGSPKTELMPVQPASPYGLEKLMSEHYCRIFHELYGLRTTALRYFNVYGPRQDPKSHYAGVIPLFMKAARDGKTLTIHGDGEQSRDFVYVEDVVRANILAAKSKASDGQVVNIGTGVPTTVRALANGIIDVARSASTVEYHPPRAGDIRDSLAAIEKGALEIGYVPRVELRAGLQMTYDWFRSGDFTLTEPASQPPRGNTIATGRRDPADLK